MKKFLLIICILSGIISGKAQGGSCSVAVQLTADNPAANEQTQKSQSKWYAVEFSSVDAKITLTGNIIGTSDRPNKIVLWNGSCTLLTAVVTDTLSSSLDSILELTATGLTPSITYYIEVRRTNNAGEVRYMLDVKNNLPIPECRNCPSAIIDSCNLICNGSFEQYDAIPTGVTPPATSLYLCGWENLTNSSPDYFHVLSPTTGNSVNIPNTYFGYQTARTGSAMVGFIAKQAGSNWHEYIYQKLKFPLVMGAKYIVSFYVKPGYDQSTHQYYYSDGIGAWFASQSQITATPITSSTTALPGVFPQITSSGYITDTTQWTEVKGTFIANGTEEYIAIGAFNNNIIPSPSGPRYSYYFLEDVSVMPDTTLILSAVPPIICKNDSALLSVDSIGGVFTYWSPNTGLHCDTCLTTMAGPNDTTTYYVLITHFPGCRTYRDTTLTVLERPSLPHIVGPTTNCDSTNNIYTITNFDTTLTYTVSFIPLLLPSTPPFAVSTPVDTLTGQFMVSWLGADAGTIVVMASNGYCDSTSFFPVERCCKPQDTTQYNFVDTNVFAMTAIPGYTTGTSTINVVGKTFYINGTFTVDQNLTLFNCRVNFGPNAKIKVINGKTLSIKQFSVLKAGCEVMWDGIYVDGSTTSKFNMGNSDFLDAINGVVSKDGAQLTVTGNRFNKNRIAIKVMPFAGTHTALISGNTFSCVPSVYTQPNIYLLPPYNTERGLMGIYVKGSGLVQNNLTIGATSSAATFNLFTTGLRIGIRVEKANVNIYNCKFNNISEQKVGKAIWAVSQIPNIFTNGLNQFKLIVGGTLSNQACEFMNCTYAVYTDTCMRSDIINNKVDRTAAGGLVLASGFSINNITAGILQVVNIKGNTIKNMDAGILCNRNTRCQTNIRDLNTIDHTWYATSTANKTGIAVTDINSTNGLYVIYNNDIKDVQIGVNLKSVNKAVVEGNRINVRNGALFFGARAIFVAGNVQAQIKNNQLKAVPAASTNVNVKGVFVQGSQSTKVYCNDIQNIGACIHFDGNTTIAASVGNNFMKNGVRGIWLSNGTALGNQGAPAPLNIASDNRWQGITNHTFVSVAGTFGNFSRIYYRNSGLYVPIVNTFGAGGTPMIPIPVTPTSLPLVCAYPVGGGDHRMMRLIAKDSADLSTQELKWLAKHGVYAIIKEDSSAYYNDTLLVRFKDSLQYENLGKLYEVQKTVGENGNILTAEAINNGVSTIDAKESYSKIVNQLLIEQQFSETVFDSTQLYTLQGIASLCPYTEGPAVYLARALVYPYNRTEYINSCEEFIEGRSYETMNEEKTDVEITVYPNPANDLVNISYNLKENQVGKIQMYDIAGALVLEQSLNSKNNLSIINTNKLNSGIYLYHIFVDNIRVQSNKLVIVK
jgi:hypothetical protein